MAVSFSNIPAGDQIKTPLFFAEMDNSAANSATATMRRLIVASVNDDITEPEIGSLTICGSLSDAKRIGGLGSMLAQMYEVWIKNDTMGEVWVLPLKLTEGVAATGTVKVTGTASESGMLSLYVGGKLVQCTITNAMTSKEAAEALARAIGKNPDLPVSAKAAEGTVTLTCKFKGLLGNDIQLEMNRLGRSDGQFTPSGLTIEITAMASGAGAPDIADIAAALGDEAFEFICQPWTDTTTLDGWKEIMGDESGRWSFTKLIFGHVYSATRGTLAELVTAGNARNDQHVTIAGMEEDLPAPIYEFAAAFDARTAVYISADPARPTQTGPLVGISPAKPSNRFEQKERNSLLGNGIATTYYEGGYQCIERGVTTYQKNRYGQADNSYLDSETLHTSAFVINYLKTQVTSKYGRHKLADDGTRFGPGQAIVTPKIIRGELIAAYSALELLGLVENSKLFEQHLIVERDELSVNRVNVLFPPDLVNQLRVFSLLYQFRLQY